MWTSTSNWQIHVQSHFVSEIDQPLSYFTNIWQVAGAHFPPLWAQTENPTWWSIQHSKGAKNQPQKSNIMVQPYNKLFIQCSWARMKGWRKKKGDRGGGRGPEERKQELMNPQIVVCACFNSSSCATVRIYPAKQTNSKNKWINAHCASAGVCLCLSAYGSLICWGAGVCERMHVAFRGCWWNEWRLCLCISGAKSRPLLFHYALAKRCNTSNRAHAGLA